MFSQIGVIRLNKTEVWCLNYLSQKGLNNICHGLEEMNFQEKELFNFLLCVRHLSSRHDILATVTPIHAMLGWFSRKPLCFSKWIPSYLQACPTVHASNFVEMVLYILMFCKNAYIMIIVSWTTLCGIDFSKMLFNNSFSILSLNLVRSKHYQIQIAKKY